MYTALPGGLHALDTGLVADQGASVLAFRCVNFRTAAAKVLVATCSAEPPQVAPARSAGLLTVFVLGRVAAQI